MPTPYGEWPSPLGAEDVAESGRNFGGVAVDDDAVYWLERRPVQDGRGVVVRDDGTGPVDLTPEDYDARTLVHQYGGGDFLVTDETVWFAEKDDQRIYRHPVDPAKVDADAVEPVTSDPPEEKAHRYADFALAPDGETLYAVRQRHVGEVTDAEPANELVRLPAEGGQPVAVAGGHDFYAGPRPSPSGELLAFVAWDHPRMPWNGTELYVAEIEGDGDLGEPTLVAGGPSEAVFCPKWSSGGALHAVSDRTGWWNLYRFAGTEPATIADGSPENLYPAEAEFGVPAWVFDLSTYAFLDDGRIATLVADDGTTRLHLLDPEAGDLAEAPLPYTAFRPAMLRSEGRRLAFVAGQPAEPTAVVSWEPPHLGQDEATEPVRHREALEIDFPESYVSEPEAVTFPTGDAVGAGETVAHAFYYPPTNPEIEPPTDERPPAVVTVHGGPTGRSEATLSLSAQFWTSRGFAVIDVNYRGSTGYGRAYREALEGEWGVRDTLDCVNAALRASDPDGPFPGGKRAEDEAGDGVPAADGDRLAVSGGSAGGYAVLCALAFHDAFDAGTSYYGVADLESLAEATHKFESRYLDSLVGPLPDAGDTYRERSPVHHAEGIDAPLLLLQGGKDEVVPPEQASTMIDALVEGETPYAYVEFPDERHGFRKAENIARAHETELAFYAEVFGFDPDDDLEPVELLVGERV